MVEMNDEMVVAVEAGQVWNMW